MICISLYSYLDIYLPHKGTFPISLPPHFPLWAYLPWVHFGLLFLLKTSCLVTSSIFSPNVWYKVKRQELLLKFEEPSALFSFSGPSAGEGLFTSPAAAFTGELNYSSVQTACLRTRRSEPKEAEDCLIRIYCKRLPAVYSRDLQKAPKLLYGCHSVMNAANCWTALGSEIWA